MNRSHGNEIELQGPGAWALVGHLRLAYLAGTIGALTVTRE